MANTRGVDGCGQPFDLPTISPPATPLGFEPVTSTLIPLVEPQALPTLLKAIACRKVAYPSLIVHSPKRPRRTQGELMDTTNPPICQHIDLGNLVEILVHHMACLGHWDYFPIVSALVYIMHTRYKLW